MKGLFIYVSWDFKLYLYVFEGNEMPWKISNLSKRSELLN